MPEIDRVPALPPQCAPYYFTEVRLANAPFILRQSFLFAAYQTWLYKKKVIYREIQCDSRLNSHLH